MSLHVGVKNAVRNFAGNFLSLSDKSRRYNVRVIAKVTSQAKTAQHTFLIFALPPATDYQRPLATPAFSVSRIDVGIDRRYRNRYAVAPLIIAPGETLEVEQSFPIEVKSAGERLPVRARIDDYQKNIDPGVMQRYLAPSRYVPAGDLRFRKLSQQILGGERRAVESLRLLYAFVRDHLAYGDPIRGLYSAYEALARDRVDCGGYATLLASLCLASGIPARVVSGFFAGYRTNAMHAWVEALLPNGRWIPMDPSTEALRSAGRTRKPGGFGTLAADRIAVSLGAQLLLSVDGTGYEIDILQHPRIFPHAARSAIDIETTFLTDNA